MALFPCGSLCHDQLSLKGQCHKISYLDLCFFNQAHFCQQIGLTVKLPNSLFKFVNFPAGIIGKIL